MRRYLWKKPGAVRREFLISDGSRASPSHFAFGKFARRYLKKVICNPYLLHGTGRGADGREGDFQGPL